MLLYIDQQVREHPAGSREELFNAIVAGVVMRVRPKLMTVSVIIAGLLPIFFMDGIGSDVMRRIALPMVGGMVSMTVLTLIVIPAIYYVWEGRRFNTSKPENSSLTPDSDMAALPSESIHSLRVDTSGNCRFP